MTPQYSIPLIFAALAFFIADEDMRLFRGIYHRGLEIGDRPSIMARLSQLGRTDEIDYQNFRIAQMSLMAFATAAFTCGLFLSIVTWGIYLLLISICAPVVIAVTERNLNSRVARRRIEIESEFPAIVEMLTLAVGAGESPAAALKRIAQRADGHIAREFRTVIKEIESGLPFTSALDRMSRRLGSDSLRRFVDSLIISISRGTPLVETLTHSANESRNHERVRLLTAAGKSEISMMIPVVFLILPISILFALYPSLTNLNLFGS